MTAALKTNDQLQELPLQEFSSVSENMASVPYSNPLRRTVLVTGGTDGIGSAICKKMADLGHFVATTYQNEPKARAWQNRMEREGYLFYIYKCDVADFRELQNLIRDVTEDLGPIHILINNAGVISGDSSHVTRAAIHGMRATGFGRIVNISSINGQKRQCGQAHYSAAKAAMQGFTKALAQEVAGNGITVNTISPGYVTTDMILSMPENVRSSIVMQIPVGRLGRPENVAHAVSFLVSEESGFITGTNIAANGGHYME